MCQGQRCYIVPQYLLRSIVESSHEEVTPEVREHADWTLREGLVDLRAKRAEIFAALTVPRGFHAQHQQAIPHRRSIVPDVLFQQIADSDEVDEDTRYRARFELEHIRSQIAKFKAVQEGSFLTSAQQKSIPYQATAAEGVEKQGEVAKFYRVIYDSQKNPRESKLPGKAVRLEGQKPTGDVAADAAYDNSGLVLQFYKDKFNWNSIDNKGMHVVSSVHFGINYENAYWDPSKMQMVYGDGNKLLYKFAECIDVIGHEMTHAITEHTSPLNYQGQSGALNEHISDVFGIMIKQFKEQETAAQADWLIGEGCLLPGVKGVALRNMKEPGTAYNDPRFGKDPQPNHMSGFKMTTADNGGVHLFSGIPNRAFYLASIAFGGFSWEKAGQIWWETMNSGRIPPRCNFVQFADVTVEVAEEKYGEEAARIVRDAWNTVGVVRKPLGLPTKRAIRKICDAAGDLHAWIMDALGSDGDGHGQAAPCSAAFDMDLCEFSVVMRDEYPKDQNIRKVLTVTGSPDDAFANSAERYVACMWEDRGQRILDWVAGLVTPGQHPADSSLELTSRHIEDATILWIDQSERVNDTVRVRIRGSPRSLVDAALQFVWMMSAFRRPYRRASTKGQDEPVLAISAPQVRYDGREDMGGQVGGGSSGQLTHRFAFGLQDLRPCPKDATSGCWHDIFCTYILATGFPIPARPTGLGGAELPFALMTALSVVDYPLPFLSGFVLEGQSVALVPPFDPVRDPGLSIEGNTESRSGRCIQWHMVLAKDGGDLTMDHVYKQVMGEEPPTAEPFIPSPTVPGSSDRMRKPHAPVVIPVVVVR